MANGNYTLERHLKSLAEEDRDYEILYSIWDLNKKNLTRGLNMVYTSFPHYSSHDYSHSMNIINNIQCFLGEDRIRQLGPTDTFLLLMAGLTHDIGMILTYKLVEGKWQDGQFRKVLESFAASSDSVISDVSRLLLSYSKNDKDLDTRDFRWALEIRNAVTLVTAEFFRSRHAKQSADNLISNEDFKQLADNFYSSQLPNRFLELLANVAYLHGEDFDKVMSALYRKANGYKGDYIHPRFIACMIRLGDLLDFDSDRFNDYSVATVKDMPDTSLLHQQKHDSVKHMLISPNSIEAELNCTDDKVYRISKSWFDWLEKEVNNQSREWTNIVPENLGGLPPVISKNSIRILYNGIQARQELLNLKFTMSQEKIFSILKGGGIYNEPGLVFIREIVQNALDASKIQLWKDIRDGYYDFYYGGENPKEQIKFPDDIKPEIYKQYPVSLKVSWKDKERKILHIECSDMGTGISEATLLRMTKFVGESHKGDEGYEDFYNDMPYWLRPTAAFGVGLQSIFFVAPTFEMETSYVGETSKRIVFRSAADNQYSSIIAENIDRMRGTTVKIDVQLDQFADLVGYLYDDDILEHVDVFDEDRAGLCMTKVDNFVYESFKGIELLNFNYMSVNPERCFCTWETAEKSCLSDPVVAGDYKYSSTYEGDSLVFKIYERRYGSALRIWFPEDIKGEYYYRQSNRNKKLLLRDIVVGNGCFAGYRTAFMLMEWNLCNQTTDQIVTISRSRVTPWGARFISETLVNKLLPEFLALIHESFRNELKKENHESPTLKMQYLNYSLAAHAFNLRTFDLECLQDLTIPTYYVSMDGKEVSPRQLFEAEELYLVSDSYFSLDYPKEKKRVEKKKSLKNKIIIWGNPTFYSTLKYHYVCTDIVDVVEYGNEYIPICRLEKMTGDKEAYRTVNSTDNKYLHLLDNVNDYLHNTLHNTIYGLSKYADIVVKGNSPFDYSRTHYTSSYIYNPFTGKDQIDKLLEAVKDKGDDEIRSYVEEHLSEYIPDSMQKFIQRHNITRDVPQERIASGYVNLIFDFIKLKQG